MIDSRLKASLLWGVVSGLSFLVLIQGYELATGELVDLPVKFGVAAVVVLGATALTYTVGYRPTAPKGRT